MTLGSSPRVWGQVKGRTKVFIYIGIIPTRVGTSSSSNLFKQGVRDHPHACGDKSCFFVPISIVWGQDLVTCEMLNGNGIIPTRVGTRFLGKRFVNYCKDHPHACGDKHWKKHTQEQTLGSSPRVWGQVINADKQFCFIRIIPTRVGTRYPIQESTAPKKDHPHACGDKFGNSKLFFTTTGSSPRVWGQVYQQLQNLP